MNIALQSVDLQKPFFQIPEQVRGPGRHGNFIIVFVDLRGKRP
jgi:hypothetical protein